MASANCAHYNKLLCAALSKALATKQPSKHFAMAEFSAPSTLCILVVDDDLDTLRVLAVLLGRLGHTVHTAPHGTGALEQIEYLQPDLVFVDLAIPDMDGFEVAKRIRHKPRLAETKIVAISGYGDAKHRQRALVLGFDGYLLKPIALAELEGMINSTRMALLTKGQVAHPNC
jgi:CheY-like chemotaxis protein